jgi:hypothetical protein
MTLPSPELVQDPLTALTARLAVLEAERAVRNVLTRYMALCDQPCHDKAWPQLADLFTADAVWEGLGALYTETFGHHQGRVQIAAFLGSYLAPSTHFRMNVHFLTSDQVHIAAGAGQASGQWVMLQASTYENGRTELVSARLEIEFVKQFDHWQISHFRTQRLFDLPWQAQQAEAAA